MLTNCLVQWALTARFRYANNAPPWP